MATSTAELGTKLTPQQEAFAQALFQGKSQFAAYQEAYPTSLKWQRNSVDCKASLMANDEKIMQRVHNLRAPLVKKVQYGVAEAMAEAQRAMNLAEETRQAGAMTAAIALRAKLHGLLIDKKEVTVTQMQGMDASERQLILEAAMVELSRRALKGGDVTDVETKT